VVYTLPKIMENMENVEYEGHPLGFAVRGSLADTVTYRVRPGHGSYGAELGKVYQDRYPYFVPSSINNPESAPYRAQWIAAVHKWKYDLTPAQKEAYNARAKKGLRISGYNLFMREAMKGEIDMYVDRGDPAAYDFGIGDLTVDGAWHDLALTGLITDSARAVLLDTDFQANLANKHINFREKGNSNDFNHSKISTIVAAQDQHDIVIVSPDDAKTVQYNIDTATWDHINMTVRGWWT